MKKNSRIRAKKVHAKKFAAIAAYSRKFTVKNTKKGISEVINHKRYGADMGIPSDKLITSPYTGIQYVMTNPHPIHGEKYDITVTGYDWVPIDEYKAGIGLLWEHKKHPQPKSYWNKVIDGVPVLIKYTSFHKDPVKMNRVQYMEKLVEHKLAKWERKNVCPEAMFTEDVEKWKQEREAMKERFRDFVISTYTKLPLMGRFEISEGKYTPDYSIKVGELKDKHHELVGDIHPVQLDPNKSPLMKKAKQITNSIHAKHANLVAVNLLDHKHKKGCLILPDKKLAA